MAESLEMLPSADEMPQKKIGWWDLPYEMREMIIEKMDDETKLAFLLCSDDCAADMPKNYITTMDISDSGMCIMSHNMAGFNLRFSQSYANTCTIKCCGYRIYVVFWKMEEKGKISDIIGRFFQRIMMRVYEVERVDIGSPIFPFEQTTLRHLKKINQLTIDRRFIKNPLENEFMAPEQLLQVNRVRFIGIPLTLSQLKSLNSGLMIFLFTKISSEDINQFLKLFQNGQIHENFGEMESSLRIGYELDYEKVKDGLKMLQEDVDGRYKTFVIVDEVKLYRVAKIELNQNTFKMKVTWKNTLDKRLYWKDDKRRYFMDQYFRSLP